MGGLQLTVEQVIRSNGQYTMNDMLGKYNLTGTAQNFFYQVQPQLGFYCIYRARENETGVIPDCENITATLTQHAAQLVAAGVDFIVMDQTNLCTPSPFQDVLQQRPFEVVLEEWAALRAKGIPTPQVTPWPCLPTGATSWQQLIPFYRNETYQDLLFTDSKTGKRIIFGVDSPTDPIDSAIAAALSNATGALVQPMWALFAKEEYRHGEWAFMTPCTDPSAGGSYSTSVPALGACNQPITKHSDLGSAATASPSFQLNYESMPAGGSGKLRGLTMKKLFVDVFAKQPDYLFISSWNEFLAQPQFAHIFSDLVLPNMGEENDPLSSGYFVDSYGGEWSRDIEPTVEYGDFYYQLVSSCIRVYRSGALNCSNSSEMCCDMTSSNVYVPIYSVSTLPVTRVENHLLTTSAARRDELVQTGKWAEDCNPVPGFTHVCTNESLPAAMQFRGPFFLYSSPPPADVVSPVAIYSCITSGGSDFFSPDPGCEGNGNTGLLGYASGARTGDTPRSLRRCWNEVAHYHSLDGACPDGESDGPIFGYVR